MNNLQFDELITLYVRSGVPLIVVDTIETDRLVETLKSTVTSLSRSFGAKIAVPSCISEKGYSLYVWNAVSGLVKDGTPIRATEDPVSALKYIYSTKNVDEYGIYIFQNLHMSWKSDFQKYIEHIKLAVNDAKEHYKHIIISGNVDEIPIEIRDMTIFIPFNLPDVNFLREHIIKFVTDLRMDITDEEATNLAYASTGMTVNEVESAISIAMAHSIMIGDKPPRIDNKILFEEKAKAVSKSGLLEYINVDLDLDSIGGFDNFKVKAREVEKQFKNPEEAIAYGMLPPKGCLIIGVAGCGKSRSGKTLASLFGVPCFRFDITNIFDKYVGGSERRMREVIRLIKIVSPCVILIDEIEKSMSGGGDNGVSDKIMSQFLTFMQEKDFPAYIVATANDIEKLNPAFMRKERWDNIFGVGLPSMSGRVEIFKIHIEEVKRDVKNYDLELLATNSEGFSGAECSSCIKGAMRFAFNEGREFTTEDVLNSIDSTVPLLEQRPDEIAELNEWIEENTESVK